MGFLIQDMEFDEFPASNQTRNAYPIHIRTGAHGESFFALRNLENKKKDGSHWRGPLMT